MVYNDNVSGWYLIQNKKVGEVMVLYYTGKNHLGTDCYLLRKGNGIWEPTELSSYWQRTRRLDTTPENIYGYHRSHVWNRELQLGSGALAEQAIINRMQEAFRDIIDICNTDPCTWGADTTDKDWMELIRLIYDIAHEGLYGEKEELKIG